ncbi:MULTISPECIES: glycosyltransferase [unclassified Moritella]|uniref:glycosyltransferase n=1 Tax=unclassified Moritella TaxID=2637987 RepID=UPI001BA49314|nr:MULTISPECIES: glycosyltransferase [unclassified Moritella]QUM84641.1 beta-1,4-galactosyltransferase [Moritella sp. 28]QUM88888.1 beta-1,4-galactosyltransferase [Moritella sp. 36]
MPNRKVLVIASAGGHLTQALCACSHVKDIVLVTTMSLGNDDKIKKTYTMWSTQKNAFIHFVNIFYAVYVLLKERPRIVFTTGGPLVLPFALVCKFLPLKFVYLDTLSRVVELSNTGKFIHKYKLYDEFMSQWEGIAREYNVEYEGKTFDLAGKSNKVITPLQPPEKPLVLVTMGTNTYPFPRLIKAMAKLDIYKDPNVRWFIQTGGFEVEEKPANGEIAAMIPKDKMDALVKESSLVISHCGVGSINHMLTFQKQVVFVPRLARFGEFSDDHQLQIAKELCNPNMKVVYPDELLPEYSVAELISIPRYDKAIDITNHTFASVIDKKLFVEQREDSYG